MGGHGWLKFLLFIAFALMDGFDLGVGTMLPFIAKTDEERRMVINSISARPTRMNRTCPTWLELMIELEM